MHVSADTVLKELQKVALHVVKDIQGSAKLRALEMLGKHLNLWGQDQAPQAQIVLSERNLSLL